jgi:hypothetical protein
VTPLGRLLGKRWPRSRLIAPLRGAAKHFQSITAEGTSQHRNGHGTIGKIVVLISRVVDHIVAAARNVTLKTDKLVEQPVVLRQNDAAGIEHRKRVTIKVAASWRSQHGRFSLRAN